MPGPAKGQCFTSLYWNLAYHQALRRKVPRAGAEDSLRRCLGLTDVVSFGVGNCIGAGLFVTIGPAAVHYAGPAVCLSFLVGGFASLLTGLCYAQLASSPAIGAQSGSSYGYVYATVNEFFGFMAGWLVSLGYIIGGAAVARGWADYAAHLAEVLGYSPAHFAPIELGGISVCPAAAGLVALLMTVVLTGVKESTSFNNMVTGFNLLLISVIIGGGISHVESKNWEPFMPFGVEGVIRGAAIVFFAFLGFDACTALGAETVDPSRTIPRALLIVIATVVVLYMFAALTLTGMVPLAQIDESAPLASAFTHNGQTTLAMVVAAGAVGTTTVNTLCAILTQPRIWLCMANHGLLPADFAKLSPTQVPVVGTVVVGGLVALLATVLDLSMLLVVTNLACLVSFDLVATGVLLHHAEDERARARCSTGLCCFLPLSLVDGYLYFFGAQVQHRVPVFLAIAACIAFIAQTKLLPRDAGIVLPGGAAIPLTAMWVNSYMIAASGPAAASFVLWLLPGVVVYFLYSRHHSALNQPEPDAHGVGEETALIGRGREVAATA